MTQQIKFNGQVHSFPDDFTEADIAAALDVDRPAKSDVPSIAQQTLDSRFRHQNDLPKIRSEISGLVSQGMPDADIESYLNQNYGLTSGDVTRMTVGEPRPQDFTLGSPNLDAFGIGGGQGVLMQGGDELQAGVGAGIDALTGKPFQESYDRRLEANRLQEALAQEAAPGAYIGGQMTGAVTTAAALPGATGARFIGGATTLPGAVVRGSTVAGLQGAGSGFLGGEGGTAERFNNAIWSGATSAVLGAALPVATRFVKWGVNKAGDLINRISEGSTTLPPVLAAAADGSPGIGGGNRTPIEQTAAPSDRRIAIERIARQLTRDEIPADQLANRLDDLGPSGALGDLGPNIKADVATVATLPGQGKTIAERLLTNRQGGRYAELVDRTARELGITQNYAQMKAGFEAMSNRASQMYEQAFAAADQKLIRIDPRPVLDDLNNALLKAKDKGQIVALKSVVKLFNQAGAENLDTTLPGLFKTKIAIDAKIADKVSAKALDNDTRRILVQASSKLQDLLKSASPEYREAAETFAAPIQAEEAFERGFSFFKDGKTVMGRDELEQFARNLTAGEREAFRMGVFEGLLSEFGKRTYSTNVASNILKTPDQVRAMQTAFGETYESIARILDASATKTDTYQRALMGSKTAQMLASQQDQTGDLAGKMASAIRFSQGGLLDKTLGVLDWAKTFAAPALRTEDSRAVLSQMLLDPRLRNELVADIVAQMQSDAAMRQAQGLATAATGRAGPVVQPYVGNLFQAAR